MNFEEIWVGRLSFTDWRSPLTAHADRLRSAIAVPPAQCFIRDRGRVCGSRFGYLAAKEIKPVLPLLRKRIAPRAVGIASIEQFYREAQAALLSMIREPVDFAHN